mgnify:CR=1 FL=1|jgi:hypothetical protein
MKITILGVIQALKNLGMFFVAYRVADIRADPITFVYALGIYALVSVPSDLYLLNKAHEYAEKQTENEIAEVH